MLSRILSRQQLHYLQNLSAHIPSRVADLIFPCLVGAFYVVIFLITFYYVGRGVNNAAAVGALGGEKHKVAVIGAGFSGLAACLELNRLGYDVTVYERLPAVGGRAQHVVGKTSNHERFQFDFGPSWYWFPDVFEAIFQRYGGKVSEFYSLKKLDPAYRVFTETSSEEDGEHAVGQSQSTDGGSGSGSPAVPSLIDVPGDAEDLLNFLANKEHTAFVQREMPGGRGARAAESTASASAPSAAINHPERLALRLFFREAHEKYVTGIYEWIWKPMVSWFEFLDPALVSAALRMDMFNGFTSHISKYVHDHWVQKILKWPVIFVGASPKAAPALYSLMTYGGHMLGTWYPENGKGFRAPVEALEHLAKRNGVKFEVSAEITELQLRPLAASREHQERVVRLEARSEALRLCFQLRNYHARELEGLRLVPKREQQAEYIRDHPEWRSLANRSRLHLLLLKSQLLNQFKLLQTHLKLNLKLRRNPRKPRLPRLLNPLHRPFRTYSS
eukprot:g9536.t1